MKELDISIIIPVHNEEDNVAILHSRLTATLNSLGKSYEIIFVDDGSTDNTYARLLKLNNTKIIKFRKNFGQTAAWSAGFEHALGKIIITMDGDLQNDPEDIPLLLHKLEEGYDVVSGWRINRHDSFAKRFFSKLGNFLRRVLLKDDIHDAGCSLKAYRRECFDDFDLYGEMHRFIHAILKWKGFKVAEVKVRHHPRIHGKTKYGFVRVFKGYLDLLNILFWKKYSARPLHLFGGLGLLFGTLGFLLGVGLLIARQFFGKPLGQSQIPLIAVLLFIVGLQLFLSGLMSDILIKNYYGGRQSRRPYSIEKVIER